MKVKIKSQDIPKVPEGFEGFYFIEGEPVKEEIPHCHIIGEQHCYACAKEEPKNESGGAGGFADGKRRFYPEPKKVIEEMKSCPPHNLIDYHFVGNWAGSVPPPNKKCTKCLMELYF